MKGGGGVVVPILLEDLKDPVAEVQNAVIAALGKLGVEAKPAVPALIRRAKDPKDPWRTEAFKALRQIAPEEAEKISPPPNREELQTPGRQHSWE